jgi:hypothetical protein
MSGNTATMDELMSFYKSEQYQNLLNEFAIQSKRKLGEIISDAFDLFFRLLHCQRRYMILDVPFEKVITEVVTNKDTFLNYQVSATEFFNEQEIDTTYLIEKFCEFYLLQIGDRFRLLNYLIIDKPLMFHSAKYAKEITQLYHQTVSIID